MAGADGLDGVAWTAGATGADGLDGVAWTTGADGATGVDGADGVDGALTVANWYLFKYPSSLRAKRSNPGTENGKIQHNRDFTD